jgi:hypothetical protein
MPHQSHNLWFDHSNNIYLKEYENTICCLFFKLSVSRLYSFYRRMDNACGAVGGMRICSGSRSL